MWKFQGEVACGAEEEREEVVQPAPSHQQQSRLQLARASHPVRVRGHWADTVSPPGSPSLSRTSHGTFLLGHRHCDRFRCQLERVPAQLVEVKEQAGTKEPFQHSAPTSQAPGICLHRAVPLCMIGKLALPVGEAQVE